MLSTNQGLHLSSVLFLVDLHISQQWLCCSLPVDSENRVEEATPKKGFFRRLKDALWKEEDEESKEQQASKF